MNEEHDIEIDESTYSLLDTIVNSNDDPVSLAALAEVDPDDFREFLIECNEIGGRDAIQLLKAAEAVKFSNTATRPVLDATIPVGDRTQKLTFIVLSKDPGDSKEIGRALSGTAAASVLLISEDTEEVFSETVRLRPSAVIIDVTRMSELGWKLVQRIALECASTSVICASRNGSPGMILRSMRAGARDFLRLPIRQEDLIMVIDRTLFVQEHIAVEPMKRGQAIAVFSSKGGCGCSVIATNLAIWQPNATVLVDLNTQAGDLDLLLGLRPKFSLADVVENRERLDDALLTRYLTRHSTNVSLLASPVNAESGEDIEPRHIYEIMERLRRRFDSVIIDTSHSFDALTISALDHADQILLILTLEIPAIRSTRRTLEIFDRLGYPRKKIRLVVNRWTKNLGLDQKQIEGFLGERVVGFIPRDDHVVVNSINLGKPAIISAPSSEFAREINRIGPSLFTDDYEPFKNIAPSRDFQVQDLLKTNIFNDFLAPLRPKEST